MTKTKTKTKPQTPTAPCVCGARVALEALEVSRDYAYHANVCARCDALLEVEEIWSDELVTLSPATLAKQPVVTYP